MKTFILIVILAATAYGVTYREIAGSTTTILRVDDGANIPRAQDNKDYIEFLAWEKAGNVIQKPESASSRALAKVAARFTVKSSTTTATQKINAVILLLDLDQ